DRAIMALVDHVPGAAIATLAIGFYPGLGLLLPLAFKWPSAWLVDANVIGVCGAAVLSLGWFAAQVEAAKRRHLIEWTTEFRHLDAEEACRRASTRPASGRDVSPIARAARAAADPRPAGDQSLSPLACGTARLRNQ